MGGRGERVDGGRRGERREPYINSTRFHISIAFSSFSGPEVRWEMTELRLSWQLQSHTLSHSQQNKKYHSPGRGKGRRRRRRECGSRCEGEWDVP